MLHADLGALNLGLMTAAPVADDRPPPRSPSLTRDHRRRPAAPCSIPESDPLLANTKFSARARPRRPCAARHARLRPAARPTPASTSSQARRIIGSRISHRSRRLRGASCALTFVSEHTRQGHPLLPVIQVAEAQLSAARCPRMTSDCVPDGDAAPDDDLTALRKPFARGRRPARAPYPPRHARRALLSTSSSRAANWACRPERRRLPPGRESPKPACRPAQSYPSARLQSQRRGRMFPRPVL